MSMSPPPPPPPPPPIEEPSLGTVPGGRPLASPALRVVARLLDSLIVALLFGAIFAAVVLNGDDGGGLGGIGVDASFGKLYLLAVLNAAAYFLWDAVPTKLYGGSPMKLAFGMRVVQQSGSAVEWEHAIKRWAIPGAFGLIPPIVGVSVISSLAQFVIVVVSLVFIFTKPLRTAVWDLFADTMVITIR